MIKLYTKEQCIQCMATKKAFDRKNIQYEVRDLDDAPDLISEVEELGYRSLPIVVHGDDHWAGFRLDKISKLPDGVAEEEE